MGCVIYIKKAARKIYSILRFKKQPSPRPRITLGLSMKCDIRCAFCLAHSPLIANEEEKITGKTWQAGKPSVEDSEYLDFKKFKEIIDGLRYLKPGSISLSGNGETLLYPYLAESIAYIRSSPKLKNVALGLSTNVVTLNKGLSEKLVNLRIDAINFSINASNPKSYEAMHFVSGSVFHKVTDNIKNFINLTNDTNKPDITATFVICKKNYKEIKEMLRLCNGLGIKKAGFRNMYFCRGKSASLKDYILDADDKIKLENLILGALIEAKGKRIFTNLNSFLNILKKGGSDNFLTQVYGAYDCQIHANGMVNPYDFPYLMGDIHKNNILQIWRSPKYARFRKMIKKKAHNKEFTSNRPFCFRCNLTDSQLANCNIIF